MRVLLMMLLFCLPLLASPLPEARRLRLETVANARQLGGIPVRGGVVRAGQVYRSNALAGLTPADQETLRKIPIRTVIDFRLEADRQGRPDPPSYVKSLAHTFWLPMDVQTSPEGYREMPEKHSEQIRQLFHVFAEPDNYPLLYHCAEGKDRTGIVSALLLEMLGASRDQIQEDYLASLSSGERFYVDTKWLNGLFEGIDKSGGIEPYLDLLRVSLEDRTQIRRLLVTR